MLQQGGSSARGSALSHLSAAFIRLEPEAVQTMRERDGKVKKGEKGKRDREARARWGKYETESAFCSMSGQVQLGCVT